MNVFSRVAVMSLLACMPVAAVSQDSSGSISGTVYGPGGITVRDVPIQATNTVTGDFARTRSLDDGRFTLANLRSGLYKLRIRMPCCAYQPYDSEDIEVMEGETRQFVVHLDTLFNTVGDDPGIVAAAVRDRQEIPDLPVPRMAEGMPDLSGVWLVGEDPFPHDPAVQPWAAELFAERVANDFGDHPHTECLPGDPPIPSGGAPTIAKFVQKSELLVILLEDAPGYRQVFLDGRSHPDDPNPSWMGHSIGYWDGDVLIIDTIGFNGRGWMNGYPRTEDLHIVELYKRPEYGRIELEVTIVDPKVFNSPWTQRSSFDLAPQEEMIEYVCENNKWSQPYGE